MGAARFQRIASVALLCAAVASVTWGIVTSLNERKPRLDQFLPDTTFAAIELTKQAVFHWRHHVLESNRVIVDTRAAIRVRWHELEQGLRQQVERVIVFWYDTDGTPRQGMLIVFDGALGEDERASMKEQRITARSWFDEQKQLSLRVLEPSLAVLSEDESFTQRENSDTSLFSIGTGRGISISGDTRGKDFFVQNLGSAVPQLAIPENSAFTATIEKHGAILRGQVTVDSALDEVFGQPFVLRMPESVDFALLAPGAVASSLVAGPLASQGSSLIETISRDFLITKDTLFGHVAAMSFVGVQADEWFMTGTSSDRMIAVAQELTSWFRPRIRERTLRDETPLREYVRSTMAPVTSTVAALPVSLWSRSTSSDASLNAPLLYTGEVGGHYFITNGKNWLAGQNDDAWMTLSEFPALAQCADGESDDFSRMRDFTIVPPVEKDPENRGFVSFAQDLGNKSSYTLCFW